MPERLHDALLGEGAELQVETVGVLAPERQRPLRDPGAPRSDRPRRGPRIAVVPMATARSRAGARAPADVLDREGALGLAGARESLPPAFPRGSACAAGGTPCRDGRGRPRSRARPNRPSASTRWRAAAPARSPSAATCPAADADVRLRGHQGPAGTPRSRGRTAPRPARIRASPARACRVPARRRGRALTDQTQARLACRPRDSRWTRSSRRSGPYRCSPISRARSLARLVSEFDELEVPAGQHGVLAGRPG